MSARQQNKHNLPKTFGNYRVVGRLGEGSTCVVAKAVHRETGQSYAVKIIESMDNLPFALSAAVEREIRLLRTFAHTSIIKLIEVIRENDRIFVVMEHCEGGTLLDVILSDKLKSISEVKRLFSQIAEGISYLHDRGIAHGDIKPDNIVLTSEGDVKLIDFGFSKECLIGFDDDKSGTVQYCAPELFRSGAYDTRKADSWSLGILLFVMATGTLPYDSLDDAIVARSVSSGRLASHDRIAGESSELYGSLRHRSLRQRPSADAIVNSQCLSTQAGKEGKNPIAQPLQIEKTESENELDCLTPF
jgi:serine/threonine protein kinase